MQAQSALRKCQHLSVLENIMWCLAPLRVGASSYVGKAAFPQHLLRAP